MNRKLKVNQLCNYSMIQVYSVSSTIFGLIVIKIKSILVQIPAHPYFVPVIVKTVTKTKQRIEGTSTYSIWPTCHKYIKKPTIQINKQNTCAYKSKCDILLTFEINCLHLKMGLFCFFLSRINI